jgi:hypothetical protein
MPTVVVETLIHASRETCFDLARDLDLHVRSMGHSGERAVAGRTSGLIGLNEDVTFEGRHFFVVHQHQSRITAFDRPCHFRDVMVRGRFRSFEHDHEFEAISPAVTLMRDVLAFESPLGMLGRIVDRLVMSGYLRRLLESRAEAIRLAAQTRRPA